MKKHIATAILILCIIPLSGIAQNKMLQDGFNLKFSFGFPPSQYGFDGTFPLFDDPGLETTFGIEIGNQWYFYDNDHFGIGLDINWFDLVYGRSKIDNITYGTFNRITAEGSFLEFGPMATYAINDMFAIDAYYNLRPTYMATYYWQNADDGVLIRDFNFLHGIGIGARFKFFYLGFESTFGSIDGGVTGYGEYEDIEDLYEKQKMSGNNSKLIIGFQF